MTDDGPLQFLGEPEFHSGLAVSVVIAAVLAAIGAWHRRGGGGPMPLAGLAFAASALVALTRHRDVPDGLVAGVALVAIAGLALDRGLLPPLLAPAAAVPGAWLIAFSGDLMDVRWIRLTVLVTVAVGGLLVAEFDRRWRAEALGPPLLAVTVVGIFYCVPDTLEAHVILGSVLPVVVLAWPVPLARLGAAGAFAGVGVLAWVVATGGWGRQSSIVGGVATLGLLALEPAVRMLRRRAWSPLDHLPRGILRAPTAASLHLVFVLVASRVAGVQDKTPHQRGQPLARGRVSHALEIVGYQVVVSLMVVAGVWLAVGRRASRRARGVAEP